MTSSHDEPTLDDIIEPTETVHPDRHDHAKTPKHPNETDLDARTEHEQEEVDHPST